MMIIIMIHNDIWGVGRGGARLRGQPRQGRQATGRIITNDNNKYDL
jgi:hypothetical protein